MRKSFHIKDILRAFSGKNSKDDQEITIEPIKKEPETPLSRILDYINYKRRNDGEFIDRYRLNETHYEELKEHLAKFKLGEYPENYIPASRLGPDDQKIYGIIGKYHGVKLIKGF